MNAYLLEGLPEHDYFLLLDDESQEMRSICDQYLLLDNICNELWELHENGRVVEV